MENATKALIIAAAILISIMVISLGIWAFTTANEQTSGAAESVNSQVVAQFNSQFETYQGTKDGAEVNALLTRMVTHNQQDKVNAVALGKDSVVSIDNEEKVVTGRAKPGQKYQVSVTYDGTDGRIKTITIK